MSVSEFNVSPQVPNVSPQVPEVEGPPQGFACPECGKLFDTQQGLGGHLSTSHKEKENCPECGLAFTPGVAMSQHMLRTHHQRSTKPKAPPKRRICPECHKSVISKDLNRHLREVHHVEVESRGPGRPKRQPAPVVPPDLKAEEITRATAALVWPEGIPHAALEILMRWHTQTVEFLADARAISPS